MKYQKVEIAATSEQEAGEILDTLLKRHLVAGGHFYLCETRHWWKGKIDTAQYYIVVVYTIGEKREGIIEAVRSVSSEDVPGVVSYEIDHANEDFLKWIEDNT